MRGRHEHRLLRTWHDETGLGPTDHELLVPDPEFHGFRQLTREEAESPDSTYLKELKAS
jgi:hypothetical protein